jgi:hypothetical protein
VWYTGSTTSARIGPQAPSVQIPVPRPAGYQFDDTVYATWSPDLDANPADGYQGELAYSRRLRVDTSSPAQYSVEAIGVAADTSGITTFGTTPTTLVAANQYNLDYELDWSRGGTHLTYFAEDSRGFDRIFTVDLAMPSPP